MIEPKELHKKISAYFINNDFSFEKDKPFHCPTQKELLKNIGLTKEDFNNIKYIDKYDSCYKYAEEKMKHSLKYLLSCLLRQGEIKLVLDELSLNHSIFIEL